MLAAGRLRHRQERELLRINGLLVHMGLLSGDLNASRAADEYGNAALLYAREVGASDAAAWYVLAKNARWRHLCSCAADLASQGLRRATPGPMTVQLGSSGRRRQPREGLDAPDRGDGRRPPDRPADALALVLPAGTDDDLQAVSRLAGGALRAAAEKMPSRFPTSSASLPPGRRSGQAPATPACSKTNPTAPSPSPLAR